MLSANAKPGFHLHGGRSPCAVIELVVLFFMKNTSGGMNDIIEEFTFGSRSVMSITETLIVATTATMYVWMRMKIMLLFGRGW